MKCCIPIGTKFNLWTTIDTPIFQNNGTYVLCRCECGAEKLVESYSLKKGTTTRCRNCGNKKAYQTRPAKTRATYIDGRVKDPLYQIWWNMKRRCECPSHTSYPYYGEKGIFVCDEWHDFSNFKKWATDHGWDASLQIDRIDNDGPYSPENCQLVTPKVNCNKRTTCKFISYNGKTQSYSDWAMELGISYSAILSRIHRGWTMDEIVKTPLGKHRQ